MSHRRIPTTLLDRGFHPLLIAIPIALALVVALVVSALAIAGDFEGHAAGTARPAAAFTVSDTR